MKTIILMLITVSVIIFIWGCAGKPPVKIGVTEGLLAPCPRSPNCVSSMAEDEKHHIDPITYSGGKEPAFEKLTGVLNAQKRTRIVRQSEDYLHVEVKSKLFRFVDDVEFFFPPDEALIHIRSASRVGYSDLGVNRKRMELIRRQLTEELKKR